MKAKLKKGIIVLTCIGAACVSTIISESLKYFLLGTTDDKDWLVNNSAISFFINLLIACFVFWFVKSAMPKR
ncbi:MAG: hypothetical protein LBO74_10835 [Candidatus Symbiothrix sp.]|jgi:hypothetical protein|nr:hypothetical protein [Candidatus Symbiothrix sp.]